MKKILAFFLCCFMALSTAACSGEETENQGGAGSGANNESSQTTESTTESATESASESSEEESPLTQKPDDTQQSGPVSFEPVTAVDNDACSIVITGLEYDDVWGYTLSVELENKSDDVTYMYSVDTATVNGVQCYGVLATEVAPGKKANDEISFMDSILEDYDIGNFTDVGLSFRVYDTDDWSADPVAEESVHVYPYGEDKAVKFEREPESTDTVVVDNDTAKVVILGTEYDDIWGYTVKVYMENKTDRTLMFTTEETSVNGYMADPYYAMELAPGACTFDGISWSDSTLEENKIEEVESIEMIIRAYDSNNWTGDDLVSEKVTYEPAE